MCINPDMWTALAQDHLRCLLAYRSWTKRVRRTGETAQYYMLRTLYVPGVRERPYGMGKDPTHGQCTESKILTLPGVRGEVPVYGMGEDLKVLTLHSPRRYWPSVLITVVNVKPTGDGKEERFARWSGSGSRGRDRPLQAVLVVFPQFRISECE